jgi:hypothetical protein
MLEQLFGSKTRVRLLRLFLNTSTNVFFVRELTRKIGAQINAVRNELENLVEMGILEVVVDGAGETEARTAGKRTKPQNAQKRKYYRLNTGSLIYPELRALFLKSRILLEKDFVRKVSQTGAVQLLILCGYFVGEEGGPTDLFLVGRVNRDRVSSIIKGFEREIGRELNYTIMTPQEYKYRRDVTDVFLYKILDAKKITVMDTVTEKMGLASVV